MRPASRNTWAKPHPVRQRSRTTKLHDFHHTGAGLAPTPPAACAGHVLLVNLSWGSSMQLSEAILFDLSWLFFGAWAIVLLASTWAVFRKDFFMLAQARRGSTPELPTRS